MSHSILNEWFAKAYHLYRGLVKWYDRGLQNLWWEFDSLIPCLKRLELLDVEHSGLFL